MSNRPSGDIATLGLASVDRNLVDLFALYGASREQILVYLRLPAALPAMLAGVRIAGGSMAKLTNCTVSGNSETTTQFGAGMYVSSNVTPLLVNTIVAGNTNSLGASDIGGPGTVSGNNNLIGTGSGGLMNGVNGNLVGVANPGLAPLGNYGGPTQTMALLPGSPAIDAGTSTGAPAMDQRGLGRVGAAWEIVESQSGLSDEATIESDPKVGVFDVRNPTQGHGELPGMTAPAASHTRPRGEGAEG